MVAVQLRTAVLIGGLGLGLGWALGDGLHTSAGDARQGAGSTGPRPLGVAPSATVSPLTEQLRLKLDNQPKAPRPSRNPFTFGSRRPGAPPPTATSEARAAAQGERAAVAAPDPPRPGSQFRLTGMATTNGPDGPELTAIVHDGHAMVFVKRGDTLSGGFEVVDVQDTRIVLRDNAGGERTLRLP